MLVCFGSLLMEKRGAESFTFLLGRIRGVLVP